LAVVRMAFQTRRSVLISSFCFTELTMNTWRGRGV
jgi:hypothetical protein